MPKRKPKLVPEFTRKTRRPRAGFIPAYLDDDPEIDTWQVWCRSANGEEERRATTADMRAAGFVRRKRKR